jgi:hypothetical protein
MVGSSLGQERRGQTRAEKSSLSDHECKQPGTETGGSYVQIQASQTNAAKRVASSTVFPSDRVVFTKYHASH